MSQTNSDTTTEGIRIEVFPEYIPEQSLPEQNQFSFSYKIKITNIGDLWAKLVARKWVIINSEGEQETVEGPGVVGYYPELNPGESFEYRSYCPLNTSWGTMEGEFYLLRNDGTKFIAKISRFYLTSLVEAE